jgi:ATP phosphoribosyltransferase regulatory subunit
MTQTERWLLPDGVNEILPPVAGRIEKLRRKLLDLCYSWGYELVMPPLIEYLESLLTGTGNDLDLETFKVIDQVSGRLMGIRADITPQVARIDAHSLNNQGIARLCYSNSVLHTTATHPLISRSPLQIGAELFGHAGFDSDFEVISLMLESIQQASIEHPITLDVGHAVIYRGLIEAAQLDSTQVQELFPLMQAKAVADIDKLLNRLNLAPSVRAMLSALPRLHGGIDVLSQAREDFAAAPTAVIASIDALEQLAQTLAARFPTVSQYFDLAELRGYQYHTGVVFSAMIPAFGQPLAKGGRYDDIGQVFGRARPATGFSTDLKVLAELSRLEIESTRSIRLPAIDDLTTEQQQALWHCQTELRATGARLITHMPSQVEDSGELKYSQQLVWHDAGWHVDKL